MYGNVIGKGYGLGKFNVKLYGMGSPAVGDTAILIPGATLVDSNNKIIYTNNGTTNVTAGTITGLDLYDSIEIIDTSTGDLSNLNLGTAGMPVPSGTLPASVLTTPIPWGWIGGGVAAILLGTALYYVTK